ncbi:MAG: hypothetical protein HY288_20545 [Planctomycetia bacterium]|nr:hypothetical protein [Planctomycetia bacterium]
MSCRVCFIRLALCCSSLAGCATYDQRLSEVRGTFYAGDVDHAAQAINKDLKHPKHDADVLKLERAIVDLSAGRPKEAEQSLREVRDRFDYLEHKSLGESALSMITDENRKSYAGEDYEKILIRSFLALSNLMSGGADAGAYSLQITDKQQQIINAGIDKEGHNPKLVYKQVALGPYIHGLIREQTHANYDDVARASAMVVSWQPDFVYGQQDLQRAQAGRHSAPGNGVLYVFTLVGRGPHKVETLEIPSTVALLIADRILSNNGTYSLPPTIAPIKVPKVAVPNNNVSHVRVNVDRRLVGSTATITDVGRMAVEQYEAIYPRVIATAVVRRIVKKGIIYGTKEVVGAKRNSFLNVALDVAGVAWEATEAADTRSWGLLPDKIQVLRIELPAGQHQISLAAAGTFGVGREDTQNVTIADGRNTYMLANFPDSQLVGKVLTSQP